MILIHPLTLFLNRLVLQFLDPIVHGSLAASSLSHQLMSKAKNSADRTVRMGPANGHQYSRRL